MAETAKQAARRLTANMIAKGYQPTALHTYTSSSGEPMYWRIRLKNPNTGEKWIRPMHHDGNDYKIGEPDFDGRMKPLYNLHEIVAAKITRPVWWVEGEQKAHALAELGLLATTAGGANSDDSCDLEPLRGRQVIVWPDNDEAGRQHGTRVAAKLKAIGCVVQIIDLVPLKLAEHGDVVDWLDVHPNATSDDLIGLGRIPVAEETRPDAPRVELLRADAVKLEPIDWLWPGWLAAGKLHIVAGPPGTGKTTICLALAATITCGGRWPDGTTAKRGDVLIWSGEDDPADTLVPRLTASGADLSHVRFVKHVLEADGRRPFDPAQDMGVLVEAARNLPELRLLILDPIVNAVGGDSHKNTEVRRALAPIVDLATSLKVAAVGISHFSKNSQNRNPVERVTGSLAFGALPRVVLAAVKVKTEDGGESRLLVRAKSNIGRDDGGFNYSLEQVEIGEEIAASRVLWGAAVEGSAQDLLADANADDEKGSALQDAADWLRDLLADGPVDSGEVERAAKANGIAWSTLRAAKKRIGAKSEKRGLRGGWSWFLPEGDHEDAEGAEDAEQNRLSTFGNSEHLRDNLGDAEVF